MTTRRPTLRKYRGFRKRWTELGVMAERPVVLEKPGNTGGGMGPCFPPGAIKWNKGETVLFYSTGAAMGYVRQVIRAGVVIKGLTGRHDRSAKVAQWNLESRRSAMDGTAATYNRSV